MKKNNAERTIPEFEFKSRNLNVLMTLTKRHLKMIFANHIRMMYTLMVPVVILVVYILFLRDLEISTIQNELSKRFGQASFDSGLLYHVSSIVDNWMMSGLLAISIITISLQVNSLIVEDKENGINRDFVASPINRNVLIASYFLYNFIITALLSLAVFIICLITIGAYGEFMIGFKDFFLILGIMLFSVLLSTLITTFVCLFIKTEGVLASIIAVFSAGAGFLMGAYMPISMLPKPIQYVCAVFPLTYPCALTRFAFLSAPLANLEAFLTENASILPAGETPSSVISLIETSFGYRIDFFGAGNINPSLSFAVTVVFMLIFLILNIIFASRLAKIEDARPLFSKRKKK